MQLLNEGFRVSIIDNLDNSVIEAVHRVKELVGPQLSKKLDFNLVRSMLYVSFYYNDHTFGFFLVLRCMIKVLYIALSMIKILLLFGCRVI